jgi:hypothetical protein
LAAIEREEDDVGIERQDPLALRAQREVDA